MKKTMNCFTRAFKNVFTDIMVLSQYLEVVILPKSTCRPFKGVTGHATDPV